MVSGCGALPASDRAGEDEQQQHGRGEQQQHDGGRDHVQQPHATARMKVPEISTRLLVIAERFPLPIFARSPTMCPTGSK